MSRLIDLKTRTAIDLAAFEARSTTQDSLTRVCDTLRSLAESMDFSEEDTNGWDVLDTLGNFANDEVANGDNEAKVPLFQQMIRMCSYELESSVVEGQYISLMEWTLISGGTLHREFDLLLSWGRVGVIDAPEKTGGYTLLLLCIVCSIEGRINAILSKCPSLHKSGFDEFLTPQSESPTSLSMYSSWAFFTWVGGLKSIDIDLEEFVQDELESNEMVHEGWTTRTLLEVISHASEPEVHIQYKRKCSDCTSELFAINVQPQWRHWLEHIKRGVLSTAPIQEDLGVAGMGEGISRLETEARSCLEDRADNPDDMGNASSDDHIQDSYDTESEKKEDPHGYPSTIPLPSECVYAYDEIICMDCWLHYIKTGTRGRPHGRRRRFGYDLPEDLYLEEEDSSDDETLENEFSSYYIQNS